MGQEEPITETRIYDKRRKKRPTTNKENENLNILPFTAKWFISQAEGTKGFENSKTIWR